MSFLKSVEEAQHKHAVKTLFNQWLKWLLEQERDVNPCNDFTGENVSRNQHSHRDAWFLAGTFGWPHPIKRVCTIPADKYLFIPVVHSDASYAEYPELRTVDELVQRAKQVALLHYNIELIVDGVKLQKDRELVWVISNPQFVILPKDNCYKDRYGVRGGPTVVVGAAYCALLEPLSEGKHNIKCKGRHDPNEQIKVPEFNLDIEYDIDVRKLDVEQNTLND